MKKIFLAAIFALLLMGCSQKSVEPESCNTKVDANVSVPKEEVYVSGPQPISDTKCYYGDESLTCLLQQSVKDAKNLRDSIRNAREAIGGCRNGSCY